MVLHVILHEGTEWLSPMRLNHDVLERLEIGVRAKHVLLYLFLA